MKQGLLQASSSSLKVTTINKIKSNFYCINSPLAFYRFHSNNFSNKTDIYLKELRNWLKQNNYKFEKKGLKLTSIKILYYKLFIKNILKKIGRVVQW